MNNKTIIGIVVLFAFLGIQKAEGRVVKGRVKGNDEFNLVGQFVFTNKEPRNGTGVFVDYIAQQYTMGHTFWAFYIDTDTSWGANYKNKTRSCEEKLAAASQVVGFKANSSWMFTPHDWIRPHIWYAVIVNCPIKVNGSDSPPGDLDVTYHVKFLNVDGSHVGFDEVGMLPLYIVYFIGFLGLTLVHCAAAYFLWLKKSMHPIIQGLAVVLGLTTFACLFVLIHWGSYHSNGIGCRGCQEFGLFLNGTAAVLFSMLLIVIASGWAITYHTLPRKKTVLGLGAGYAAFFFLLFIIVVAAGTNMASTQFVYASGGILALVIIYILFSWLVIFAYFAYSLYHTFREETQYDKRIFYLVFGIGFGLWFIVPALFNFISMGVAEWYRPRVVDAFQLTATFIGTVALVVLLWPSRVERYFRIISADILTDGA